MYNLQHQRREYTASLISSQVMKNSPASGRSDPDASFVALVAPVLLLITPRFLGASVWYHPASCRPGGRQSWPPLQTLVPPPLRRFIPALLLMMTSRTHWLLLGHCVTLGIPPPPPKSRCAHCWGWRHGSFYYVVRIYKIYMLDKNTIQRREKINAKGGAAEARGRSRRCVRESLCQGQ